MRRVLDVGGSKPYFYGGGWEAPYIIINQGQDAVRLDLPSTKRPILFIPHSLSLPTHGKAHKERMTSTLYISNKLSWLKEAAKGLGSQRGMDLKEVRLYKLYTEVKDLFRSYVV